MSRPKPFRNTDPTYAQPSYAYRVVWLDESGVQQHSRGLGYSEIVRFINSLDPKAHGIEIHRRVVSGMGGKWEKP